MWPRILFASLIFVSACSGIFPTEDPATEHTIVTVDGPLRLTVTDAPSRLGVSWLAPNATATESVVSVRNTRYGSTCHYAVSGHANVEPSTITLVVSFSERSTSCPKDIQSLSYRADISGLARGQYDVVVIHDESGVKHTARTQIIVVP